MNTLLTAGGRSHGRVRAAVLAASLAVMACFGAAIGLGDSSLEAAEAKSVAAAN